MNKTREYCPNNDRALFGALATSVLVVNRSLNISQVNSAAEGLLEQSATKLIGRRLQEVKELGRAVAHVGKYPAIGRSRAALRADYDWCCVGLDTRAPSRGGAPARVGA